MALLSTDKSGFSVGRFDSQGEENEKIKNLGSGSYIEFTHKPKTENSRPLPPATK